MKEVTHAVRHKLRISSLQVKARKLKQSVKTNKLYIQLKIIQMFHTNPDQQTYTLSVSCVILSDARLTTYIPKCTVSFFLFGLLNFKIFLYEATYSSSLFFYYFFLITHHPFSFLILTGQFIILFNQ